MKLGSAFTLKSTFITLSVLMFSLVIYKYAMGNITFPNTFSNGTVADANQINSNFNAINQRQTFSNTSMAGDWFFTGNVTSFNTACSSAATILLSFKSDGSIVPLTIYENNTGCDGGLLTGVSSMTFTIGNPVTSPVTTGFNLPPNFITINRGIKLSFVVYFLPSKDLNSLVFLHDGSAGVSFTGTAVRI